MDKAQLDKISAEAHRASLFKKQQVAAIARLRPDVFQQFILRDETTGNPIKLSPSHKEWHPLISKHDRLVLWSHVEAAKSQAISISRVLWELGNNRRLRCCVLSNTHGQAVKLVRAIANHIESNDRLHQVWRDFTPHVPWTDSAITVSRMEGVKDPSVQAMGMHGALLGARLDLVVVDDVLDYENTRTPEARQKTWDWFQATVMGRLTEKARIIVVGTAFHPCLAADSPVLTQSGIKEAAQITENDLLLVGPGKWEKPVAIKPTAFTGDLVSLDLSGVGYELRMTSNHRVPIYRVPLGHGLTRGKPYDVGLVEAGDLKRGDYMVLDRSSEIGEQEILAHEPAAPSRIIKDGSLYGVRPFASREVLESLLREGVEYREIGKRYGVTKSTVRRLVIGYRLEPGLGTKQHLAPGFSLREEWWSLAGYWLAEGNIHGSRNGAVFTFGKTEEEKGFAEDTARCALAVGLRSTLSVNAKGCHQVRVQCKQVVDWLVSAFGEKAKHKKVSWWVEQAPRRFVEAMLRAYWRGDGSLTQQGHVRFTTASMTLAYGVQRTLANIGLHAAVYHSNRPTNYLTEGGTLFEVRMDYASAVELGLSQRQPRSGSSRHPRILHNGLVLIPIKKVSRVPYVGKVYDFQTTTGWFSVPNARVHNSDLLHRLAAQPGWIAKRYPVISEAGEPSWPERWSLERVERKRLELGPLEFSRQMLCLAYDDSAARFKKEWIDACLARGKDKDWGYALASVPLGSKVFTGVDLAIQQHAAADYTVLSTVIFHPNGDREILDIQRGKWSGPDIVARIVDTHKRFQGIVIVENNAAQKYLEQYTRDQGIPVRGFTTGRNKSNPDFGVESLAAEMAAAKWIFPCRGGISRELSALMAELVQYDPASHVGDCLMSLWFAREGARMAQPKAQQGKLNLLSR